jgi:uncharacterized protein with NRDE domain
MCLVALGWQAHADADLVLVAHRDEFHDRPTAAMHWWPGRTWLAGQDLRSGGTWLGLDTHGRFGVITNLRGAPMPPAPPTRGELITRFLESAQSPFEFLSQLSPTAARYAGFNLLLGDRRELWCLSSLDTGPPQRLGPGIHVLTNGPPGVDWPKVRVARERLAARLALPLGDAQTWLSVLDDRSPPPDHELPNTGIGLALERQLAPAFIVHPEHGTRSATALLATGSTRECVEQHFLPDGTPTRRETFRFSIA